MLLSLEYKARMLEENTYNKNVDFIGAKGLVYIGDKFITYRRDGNTSIFPFYIDLPGGGREVGESPFQTFQRETMEEFGITVEEKDIIFSETHFDPQRPEQNSYFMVTRPLAISESDIVFGNEGLEYSLMSAEEFLGRTDVVSLWQELVKRYIFEESRSIIITRATASDAEGISNVSRETWLATYPNEKAGITKEDIEDYKDREYAKKLERLRDRLIESNPDNKFFVAKQGDRVIGFCSVKKNPKYNELKSIYVLPEFQGHGIGKRLWQEILTDIADNTNKIILHVVIYNQPAIDFYKKLGFEETGKVFCDEETRMKSGAIMEETELVMER